MGLKGLLYLALAGAGIVFAILWVQALRRDRAAGSYARPSAPELAIGFVTDFFDTLGVGSFAPTTSLFRLLDVVPAHLIPGTLLVGHALPSLTQALIYIAIIEVDAFTLVSLIGASVAGAWLGAGLVSRWSKRRIQTGMGIALIVAALIIVAGLVRILPAGGDALGLSNGKLLVGLCANFVLGALMTIGIGAYAPSLVVFGLLGMSLRAVFPVMMGSCALLMPVGGLRFIRQGSYSPRAALGLTLGGIPGVLLAAFIVKSLPLDVLRWLVVFLVLYTAVVMLRAAASERSR